MSTKVSTAEDRADEIVADVVAGKYTPLLAPGNALFLAEGKETLALALAAGMRPIGLEELKRILDRYAEQEMGRWN